MVVAWENMAIDLKEVKRFIAVPEKLLSLSETTVWQKP